MSAPVPPLLVPGWIIDSVIAENAHTLVVAARGAEPITPPAPPRFATIVITRPGHEHAADLELAALVALRSIEPADLVGSVIVMWDGHGVAARVLRDGVRYAPETLDEPTVRVETEMAPQDPAFVTEGGPADAEAAPRRRAYAMVALAAALAVFTAWMLATGDSQTLDAGSRSAERSGVVWDPLTATVSVRSGGQVRTFHMGEPGDEALFGDWEGHGDRTPALYRPTTGELWFFTEWATDDEMVEPSRAVLAIVNGRAVVERNHGVDVVVVRPEAGNVGVRPRSG